MVYGLHLELDTVTKNSMGGYLNAAHARHAPLAVGAFVAVLVVEEVSTLDFAAILPLGFHEAPTGLILRVQHPFPHELLSQHIHGFLAFGLPEGLRHRRVALVFLQSIGPRAHAGSM